MKIPTAATARDYAVNFAYGSNMAVERIRRRIPAAEKIGNAKLAGYCLRFHKVSQDGSAKCDIVPDHSPDAVVHGVLFRIALRDLAELDRVEGRGYTRIKVLVMSESAGTVAAETYVATAIDPGLLPYSWYKQHVLRGAIAGGLPASYIAMLEAVVCTEDPDRVRHARELSVYK